MSFLPIPLAAFVLAGLNRRTVAVILIAAIVVGFVGWNLILKDYQKKRIMTLLNPNEDPRGAGYHVRQSRIAIGSGGLIGKGFLKGTQSQLRFLPARHTDFIFSVLGEEFGFLGVFIVLVSYFLFLARLFLSVPKSRDRAGMYIIFMVACLLTFPFLVNTMMIIGLFPDHGGPDPAPQLRRILAAHDLSRRRARRQRQDAPLRQCLRRRHDPVFEAALAAVEKPGRYTGGEWNSVRKDPARPALRVGLAFPDVYEIGMSYLGQKILYHLINGRPEYARRAGLRPLAGFRGRAAGGGTCPLSTLESRIPLAELDVLGFSLLYELNDTNVLTILDLGRIPRLARERAADAPLVIGGGPAAFNPEPLADVLRPVPSRRRRRGRPRDPRSDRRAQGTAAPAGRSSERPRRPARSLCPLPL